MPRLAEHTVLPAAADRPAGTSSTSCTDSKLDAATPSGPRMAASPVTSDPPTHPQALQAAAHQDASPPLTTAWRALMALPLLQWPEHGEALSHHEPMVLDALWRLGATAEAAQQALPRLRPRPPARSLSPAELMQLEAPCALPHPEVLHGQVQAWPELVHHERAQLRLLGPQAALAECLDAVLPGAGGAAFHPVIRLAHAWPHGEMARAQAMAYARARFMPLPPARAPAGLDMGGTPEEAHPERLPSVFWQAWQAARNRMSASQVPPLAHAGLIAWRMQGWAQTPEHAHFAGQLLQALAGQPAPQALQTLARWAALAYAATGSFTVLHMATASHALIQLHEHVPDAVLWPRHLPALVSAYAAAWLSTARMDLGWGEETADLESQSEAQVGTRTVLGRACAASTVNTADEPGSHEPPEPFAPLEAWRQRLLPALLARGDDHDIKLTAALLQRWQADPQAAAVWQQALSRLALKLWPEG